MAPIDQSAIREHMDVVAADGATIGKVDHMQDGKIKLTKNDSPDHQHHLVPLSWVRGVDNVVQLDKTLTEIRLETGSGVPPGETVPDAVEHDTIPTKS